MYAYYEEDGDIKAGTILVDNDSSVQMESQHGKRTKVKTANILLRFAAPAPAEAMETARGLAAGIDTDFLWEAAAQDEFAFGDLADRQRSEVVDRAECGALRGRDRVVVEALRLTGGETGDAAIRRFGADELQFGVGQDLLRERGAAAAVALRNLDAHDTELEHLVDQGAGNLRVFVHLAHERTNLTIGEFVHAVAKQDFVFGEARQRTVDEYSELFRATGFELTRVLPTAGAFGIVEARPV